MWDDEKFCKALNFAIRHHKNQMMIHPGDLPYFCHFTSVTSIALNGCLKCGGDWDFDLLVQTALLHDVIEDTDATFVEIEQEFGTDVANGVLALSKNNGYPKAVRIKYSVEEIKKQPKEIWCVKLADRIFNLKDISFFWTKEHIEFYKSDAQLILDNLGEANSVLKKQLEESINRL